MTVVVDRSMANDENLRTIRNAGYYWLVAPPQPERVCFLSNLKTNGLAGDHPEALAVQ